MTRTMRGTMNGYGLDESAEAMRGGKKCPLCKGPMSRDARFCATCAPEFAAWLRRMYGREVKSIKPKSNRGGRVAVGNRSRRRTLAILRGNGPTAAKELARLAGLTAQGVREQMHIMNAAGEVVMTKKGNRHIWSASEALPCTRGVGILCDCGR